MMTINREKKRLGIYIHIPFCIRKCSYCDFLSYPCEEFSEEDISAYFMALEREIHSYEYFKEDYVVDTVFIGGGTPSAVDEGYIADIMDNLRMCFDMDEEAEITIEVNPGTLTPDKARRYVESGINRISMGVQSFDEEILQGLGRIHGTDDIYSSFEAARNAGFRNISIDLMFAVPELSMEIWKETLEKAVSLSPEHISFYSLQIEEGTLFGDMYEKCVLIETSEEVDRWMYHYGIDYLKDNGYLQYEISNAAKEGFASRHNMKYWSLDEYLGLGLGASSYIRPYMDMDGRNLTGAGYGNRMMNPDYMEGYLQGMEPDVHENTYMDDVSEFVFTGLRRTDGISLEDFHSFAGRGFFQVFGEDMKGKIDSWVSKGYAVLEKEREEYGDERDYRLRLTVPGFDISNRILMEFV